MASYQLLTAIQAILIVLCAFSVVDFGVELARADANEEGLGFNKFLFDEGEGLPDALDFLADNDFWGHLQLWGYLMMSVGAIQVVKSATVED
ncbi:MAG: hypothetical protein ACFFGZ_07495 [Candidatus Thorarchaeota archaeon]